MPCSLHARQRHDRLRASQRHTHLRTYVHVLSQARFKELEVPVFYGELSDTPANGQAKACSQSRHDLCLLVQAVWSGIDHAAISHKAYQQTGPLLPLRGPIYTKDVCRDLRGVWQDMCPHPDPYQIGTEIRDEAEELVTSMWGRQVNT